LLLLALFPNLVSLAVEAVSKVFLLLVLSTLESAQYQQAFGPQQVPMLANLALLFFGGTCLVNGCLIFKVGYFPKALGVLMQAAGGCCLVACWVALFAAALTSSTLLACLPRCCRAWLAHCPGVCGCW